jgi:N-acetylglucosaminyldiphosphoundecaprenol N-acetyl-beta-D-mannosaminyltransferase
MEWVQILGCPITKLSLEEFVSRAEEFIQSKKPHYIAVVNVAKVIKIRSDTELKQSVLGADLIGADGVPLVWASRLLGNPLPGRVNGTDLMYKLLEKANEKGYRIFFFGATEEVLQRVVQKARQDYPGIKVAGYRNGYFTAAEKPDIAHQIRESKPDILFLAFGTPMKELWVKQYVSVMRVPVIHGVGGSFDVMAGAIPRAPLWMQRNGLEWFFRLLQEPRRMWQRYLLTNSLFISLFLVEWALVRFGLITTHAER